MRKTGDQTKKNCWNIKALNNDNILFEKDYPSLKSVGEDLGFTYNRVVELSIGRKKQASGKYDTQYIFTKLNKKECLGQHKEEEEGQVEKLNM